MTANFSYVLRWMLSCCALLLGVTVPSQVSAATITVTSTADSGAGTLRAALASASNGDTINFALPTPSTILLTSGELLVSNSLQILGPGANNLAVDGNAASRVFHVGPSNVNTIAGLTVTNGFAMFSIKGGGIYNDRSTLTVSNCTVTGNGSDYAGGGIYNNQVSVPGGEAALRLVGCFVYGNSGVGFGGGICNSLGTLQISNCSIFSNSVDNGNGGGVWNGGTLSIANSCISSNFASTGGGIENQKGASNALAQITGSSMIGNYAGYGGAIQNSGGIVAITNSVLADNLAVGSGAGGAINSQGAGSNGLQIVNCTLSGNAAVGGGGIGGAIYNGPSSSSPPGIYGLLLLNSTIRDNSAGMGGGIYLGDSTSPVRLGGSILNRGASGENIWGFGNVTSLGFNLCSDNGGSYLTNATDQINTDPMLGPLQDNGGPTFTSAPLPGSPAIDKGKNFSGAATDQRGFPRTFDKAAIANAAGGDGTDIGAVESQSYTVVNTNDSGTGSLRKAISDSNAQSGTNTIDFAPSAYGTLLLTSGELLITNNLFLAGPGVTNESVNGNAASRVFDVAPNHTVFISDLTITNGKAGLGFGGGIYNGQANLTVSNCAVSGNTASAGGGIYSVGDFGSSASLTVINCGLKGNRGTNNGGGIVVYGGSANSTLVLKNSTLQGNRADNGAGVYSAGTGTVQVVNSTISSNLAQTYGGGIYSAPGGVTKNVQIYNTTFQGDSAGGGLGGNIFMTGNNVLQLGSTILGDFSGGNIFNNGGAFTSLGFNISTDAGVLNTGGGTGSLTGTADQMNTDPMLGPLQDNGGRTFTHAPLPGSPAIDAGKNFSASGTDQRGFNRVLDIAGISTAISGDGTDIGAVEWQAASLRLVNSGVVSNQFGFNLVGPFANIVVEASSDFVSWAPLATNTLGDAPLRVNDPAALSVSKRFYRGRVQ